MDPTLRHAWTEVISADDYETHMAAIGQAHATASLTEWLLGEAGLRPGSRITVAGAGAGQMFEFLDPALFLPHQLTCADLNPVFLARLEERLAKHGLHAAIIQDDLENTRLTPGEDLLLATLVLEHIDWKEGVRSISQLRPGMCGIILQVNPPGVRSAVTPERVLPPSMQAATETWNPVLLPAGELISSFEMRGFSRRARNSIHVADGKELQALLLVRE